MGPITDSNIYLFLGGIFALTCLGVIVIGGFAILVLYGIKKQRQKQKERAQLAAANWLSTQGRIVTSRVEVSGYENAMIYKPKVVYAYTMNGTVCYGAQIEVGVPPLLDSESAYATIDRYPLGAEVTVFYNPENPAETALER